MPTTHDQLKVSQWPEILEMLWKLPKRPRRILVFGKPGTGKTTWAMSRNPQSERITLNQGMFADALLGKFLLKDGSTYYAYGAAARAFKTGVPLIIDEIHKGGAELDSTLNAVLDDESVAKLNLDNGETINPAEGFSVIATMNGSPDQLAQPVLDRFDIVLRADTPHTGILRRLSPAAAAFIANKYNNEPDSEIWVPDVTVRRMLQHEALVSQGVPETLSADIMFGEGQGKTVLMAMVDAARNS